MNRSLFLPLNVATVLLDGSVALAWMKLTHDTRLFFNTFHTTAATSLLACVFSHNDNTYFDNVCETLWHSC